MANINPVNIEFFDSYAKELESKFRRVDPLVRHATTTGNYHEEILKSVLRNFLSKRFSVKSGFVYRGDGEVSNQVDILIIDENASAAYIFQEGDFAIVIPEAVVAALEVKTVLNAESFVEAVENIRAIKKLMKFPATVPGIVFGYSSTKPTPLNLENWFSSKATRLYSSDTVLNPDEYIFFKSGGMLSRFDEKGNASVGGKYHHLVFRDKSAKKTLSDAGWHLSIMLARIVSACEHKEFTSTYRFTESKAGRLVQLNGSMISNERFAFGEKASPLKE